MRISGSRFPRGIAGPTRRAGAIVAVVAFSLLLFLSLTALVVDGGRLHQRKGRVQCLAELAAWSALAATRGEGTIAVRLERAQAVAERVARINGLPPGSLKVVKPRTLDGRLVRLTVVGRLEVAKLMPYGPKGNRVVEGASEARFVGTDVVLRRPED